MSVQLPRTLITAACLSAATLLTLPSASQAEAEPSRGNGLRVGQPARQPAQHQARLPYTLTVAAAATAPSNATSR